MTPEILAHLWQSTLFVGAAWLVTLALRTNQAQVRYWVWFGASVKFLIPFSLLIGLGTLIPHRRMAPPIQTTWGAIVEDLTQPPALPPVAKHAASTGAQNHSYVAAASALWACGFLAVAISWLLRWRRVQILRRSAQIINLPTTLQIPVPIMSAPDVLEPGVYGLFRPVLLLPDGIADRLSQTQLDAILTHEFCHVRRKDNLTATIHMVVQAIFWFHPLTWWIGTRLVDERERACDEEVLRQGCKPNVYAESILTVCKLYLESPLACVSGVTGSNLKKRIEEIMRNRSGLRLNLAKKAALAAVGMAAASLPIIIGTMNAPAIRAQAAAAPKFEVASIKPNVGGNPGLRFSMFPTFIMENVTFKDLVKQAYDIEDFQISGGPGWINSDHYDIRAKMEGTPGPGLKGAEEWVTLQRQRLQTLLQDRFKLTLHRETKELPIYALTVAKGGLKLKPSSCITEDATKPPGPLAPGTTPMDYCGYGGFTGRGQFEASTANMAILVKNFSLLLGRTVVDKTGVTGVFRVQLTFVPDDSIVRSDLFGDPGTPAPSTDTAGSNIFTAIQEQLGLKLESSKGPVEILVIDRVERPSEN